MRPNARLLVATRKGLLQLKQGSHGWQLEQESHLGISVLYACVDARTQTLWASLEHGHWGAKLQRSQDKGNTWEEISSPKYPIDAVLNNKKQASLEFIWCITPGGIDQPERLYLGTGPGGLFCSNDGGQSFDLVTGLWNHPTRLPYWQGGGRDVPAIHSIVVDPRNSKHVFVGISCGGVYKTEDDGVSWVAKNKGLTADFLPDDSVEAGHDPHLLTCCQNQPDVMWQQNHCGVFRSINGGNHWQDVSQQDRLAYFGFAIAAHPEQPDTAWIVPSQSADHRMTIKGALAVCRTTDGGQSWQELRNGLPQQNAYDVVYRHALALSGQHLAFGSTTGNLYFSEDSGDSWQNIGHHFPPIYAVQFVEETSI